MIEPTPTQRELFEAALALAPEQRAAYLAAHCTDPAQRMAIERMLAADVAEDARVLDESLDDLLERVGDFIDEAPPPGTRIGPFRLLDKLGEGGSSIVFRAEREQAGVRQVVALKLLRRGLYAQDEQRRFRDERRALTQLRHPGIAHLIEGGVTDAGVPYIALELIDGEPITDHARNRHLGLRQRLGLFVNVCRAVEAAHRALIVHRDLKPSNVLVTREGEVKLLDFGIAKLLDADAGSDGTRTQHQAMTPAYAAPEQFNHGQITTATDVYALGVLLGELISGSRHEHGDTRTPSSRISENVEPGVLPATAKITRRQLRGDLDNIVLKATATEPEQRYASAGAFADDIERHLSGQPVIAHPPSRWYRTHKFVARHRGGVATTAAFLLAILAALGLALWQADVARHQAQIAREQARRAEAVRDLLVGIFDAEIPSRPHAQMPGTAELLERGAQRARTDLVATPAVQSDLLTALGRVYDHLALPDKSGPLLDDAVAAARRVDPPDPALLGAALSERGEVDLTSNRFAQAIVLFDQAIALQNQADPGGLALAVTLDRRALAESQSGKHDDAIADYRTALAIRQKRLPPDDPEILNSYDSLGNAYNRAGLPQQATAFLRVAVDGARRKFGEAHVKTAHYTKNYAANQGMLRHYAEAAALTEQAVRIERTLYPKGSPDIVNGLNNLGVLDLTLGRLHAALDALDEGRAVNREAGLDESLGQTFVLGNLARVREILGDHAQAADLLREAERTAAKVVGADHARTVSLNVQRARLEFASDPTTAPVLLKLAQRVLEHPENLAQFRARTETEARCGLGLAQAALGEQAQAGATLKQAVDGLPSDHVDPLLLPAVVALAGWQRAQGASDAAEVLLRGYIDRAGRELPASHYALGELHLALAELLAAKRPAEANSDAMAADAAFSELPESHPSRQRAAALQRGLGAHSLSKPAAPSR
jgi:serine/threonine-protein kinase